MVFLLGILILVLIPALPLPPLQIVPAISTPGDDGNYGSVAMYDTLCLQHLSKRVHCGMFVAEAKFQAQKSVYTEPIKRGDGDAIMRLLTDEAVEQRVLARVRLKAATFGQVGWTVCCRPRKASACTRMDVRLWSFCLFTCLFFLPSPLPASRTSKRASRPALTLSATTAAVSSCSRRPWLTSTKQS